MVKKQSDSLYKSGPLPTPDQSKTHVISSQQTTLGFTGASSDGVALFDYKGQDGVAHKLGFSLKLYHPANGTDTYAHSDNDASGAYIFKPMENDTKKYPYSTYKTVDSFKGDVVNAIVLQYASDSISEIYTVIIRMLPYTQVIEFEVMLHGIPISDGKGKEVVTNWEILGFDNAGVFYTDSNGLEMQKRVLNQRPDWTLVTDEK